MAQNQIKTIAIRHDAILDFILVNPAVPLSVVAANFGVTQSWLSIIVHSDCFQLRLAEKQDELFGTTIIPLREKLLGIAHMAVEKLGNAIENNVDPDFTKDSTDMVLKNLGFGRQSSSPDRPNPTNVQQNNYYYQATPQDLEKARGLIRKAQENDAAPQPPPQPGSADAKALACPEGV